MQYTSIRCLLFGTSCVFFFSVMRLLCCILWMYIGCFKILSRLFCAFPPREIRVFWGFRRCSAISDQLGHYCGYFKTLVKSHKTFRGHHYYQYEPYKYTLNIVRGGAVKSLARPTFRCRRTESIVSLERGFCSCRIASIFLLQRLKGSMSGDARDFYNIETRAVIMFFFSCKARCRRKFTLF